MPLVVAVLYVPAKFAKPANNEENSFVGAFAAGLDARAYIRNAGHDTLHEVDDHDEGDNIRVIQALNEDGYPEGEYHLITTPVQQVAWVPAEQ